MGAAGWLENLQVLLAEEAAGQDTALTRAAVAAGTRKEGSKRVRLRPIVVSGLFQIHVGAWKLPASWGRRTDDAKLRFEGLAMPSTQSR